MLKEGMLSSIYLSLTDHVVGLNHFLLLQRDICLNNSSPYTHFFPANNKTFEANIQNGVGLHSQSNALLTLQFPLIDDYGIIHSSFTHHAGLHAGMSPGSHCIVHLGCGCLGGWTEFHHDRHLCGTVRNGGEGQSQAQHHA